MQHSQPPASTELGTSWIVGTAVWAASGAPVSGSTATEMHTAVNDCKKNGTEWLRVNTIAQLKTLSGSGKEGRPSNGAGNRVCPEAILVCSDEIGGGLVPI
eukprot:190050-Rhodomonas_salina.5